MYTVFTLFCTRLTVLFHLLDFDGVSLSVIPSNELVSKELGTLVINVSSVPAATEIRLSRNNVVLFSSSNGNLNKSIGTVTVNENNHIQYVFTVDKSWNTTVTAYAKHSLGSNTSTQVITVLGELCDKFVVK